MHTFKQSKLKLKIFNLFVMKFIPKRLITLLFYLLLLANFALVITFSVNSKENFIDYSNYNFNEYNFLFIVTIQLDFINFLKIYIQIYFFLFFVTFFTFINKNHNFFSLINITNNSNLFYSALKIKWNFIYRFIKFFIAQITEIWIFCNFMCFMNILWFLLIL